MNSKEREALSAEDTLKLALEALENTTPTGFNMESDKRFYEAITAIKAAPEAHKALSTKCVAQPAVPQVHKQEPVAWYDTEEYGNIRWASEWSLDEGTPLYTTPYVATPRPQRKPLPIEPDHETNDGGWAVSSGGYCNIFLCEDDADDWIIEKGGDPHDPKTYTKRELVEKRKPLTDEQRKGIMAMWSREHRNYTVADIIDAVEAAHGIYAPAELKE